MNAREECKLRPWTIYWVKHLKLDSEYKHIRLKQLNNGHRNFIMPPSLIDAVDAEEFYTEEKDRLPFFVGTQFGVSPREENLPGFVKIGRKIAILGKSQLSGSVAGLTIYQYDDDGGAIPIRRFKIRTFSNEKIGGK